MPKEKKTESAVRLQFLQVDKFKKKNKDSHRYFRIKSSQVSLKYPLDFASFYSLTFRERQRVKKKTRQ